MSLRRVVITGAGVVSPYGLGYETFVKKLWANASAIKVMDSWREIRGLHSYLTAHVPTLDAKKLLPRSFRRTMGKMAVYAYLAAKEAVEKVCLSKDLLQSGQVGVAIGSTTGSPAVYEDFYASFFPNRTIENVRSGYFFKIMGHTCAANVVMALGLKGEQWSPVSACTSSAQALALGYLLIKAGRQEVMLCGGADEVHHTVTMIFDVVQAASRKNDAPNSTPRPFDRDRDGVVCGGGAGVLVLESLEYAQKRGAPILAELIGFGHLSDSSHIANPNREAMVTCMRQALSDAQIAPEEVDYVNAHATGTEAGDQSEGQAIAEVLGSEVPVSSLKGHFGHTLAAAGALETIAVLEMFQRQELLPTLNLENPDPACGKVNFLRHRISKPVKIVLKNAFAFGGVNISLVLRRWSDGE